MSAKRDLVLDHVRLINRWQDLPRFSAARREVLGKLNGQLPELNRILRELGPDLGQISGYLISERVTQAPVLRRALDLLEHCDRMPSECRLQGVAVLPVNFLHPLVWEPAMPQWDAGLYRLAVNEAANHVNEFTQKRLGRTDISDTKLMGEAFSDKRPEPGKPRLRCPGDQGSETVRIQQVGAVQFSQGVYLAMRNPAHHRIGDWNPLTAFEYLASLSTVARWVTSWNLSVYVYTPPPPNFTVIQQNITPASQAKA
jgi:hypothetical protein